MITNITNQNFKARIVFINPKTVVKPYVKQRSINTAVLHKNKTSEPSWLLKLLFGIKKKTKLPSLKGE